MKLLGEEREISRIQLTRETQNNGTVKFLNYDEPENYSVGEKQGKTGNTGIANCFYDIPNNQEIDGKSRLDTVWEHAKHLRYEQDAKVCWYTPKLRFNENDNFILVSLEDICDSLNQSYPTCTLILRIDIQQRTFFAINFPTRKGEEKSRFNSIIYELKDPQYFLCDNVNIQGDDTLFKLLIEIISSNGVSSDYVDSKDGKMSMFRHVEAKKTENNWVKSYYK